MDHFFIRMMSYQAVFFHCPEIRHSFKSEIKKAYGIIEICRIVGSFIKIVAGRKWDTIRIRPLYKVKCSLWINRIFIRLRVWNRLSVNRINKIKKRVFLYSLLYPVYDIFYIFNRRYYVRGTVSRQCRFPCWNACS